MKVLGISGGVRSGNQDGAAALLIDGKLAAAAEEERFNGVKFANGLLPRQAARYCLREAGLDIRDLDAVVFPGKTYVGFRELLERFFRFQFGHSPPILLVDHHRAHAASTFYGSGFDDALVITMDNTGEEKSTTARFMTRDREEVLDEIFRPNSLGLYYSCVTQYLGFQKDSDEYKVMGMAAYGQPNVDFSRLLEVTSSGYRFHADFVLGVIPKSPSPSKQEPLFDHFPLDAPTRIPGTPFTQRDYDVAASAQRQLEEAGLALARHYVAKTGAKRICLAGGVALNCLMNQRIRESGLVESLYVPPVCSDAGLALGAAYLAAKEAGDEPSPLPHAYWGPSFAEDEIKHVLDRSGAAYQHVNDPAAAAVERILEGKIVGWFQGRMEYGPRALGARSLLADPRDPTIKDVINAKVKFREEFRPIAPSVLHEAGPDWFLNYADSPYMTQTFTASERARHQAAAIVHEDGTCRIQSVHRETNPLYHRLIELFAARTGVPMVVNTSLNAYNDPMACEPHQALRTYFATGLDCLILGPFVLDKKTRAG